jgi:hypothetical protein
VKKIFISYKREDETRVGQLVRALERQGLSVWWDRGIGGGVNWRQEIQCALDGAKCVIVVWTQHSVGSEGDFVRDEAADGKRRGVLVPVLLDKVALPLGFREVQVIDLTRWKGNPRDPFFGDLYAAVVAKLEGRPAPSAKGPTKRLVRRLAYSSLASAIGFGGLAFAFDVLSVQERLCRTSVLQPRLSDACGVLGLGHRPQKAERIAWELRVPGSCAALRSHLERFPAGAYREVAGAMLSARRVRQTEVWTPTRRRLALFAGSDGASPTNSGAQAAALAKGRASAERLCKGFAATTSFRFTSITLIAESWRCSSMKQVVVCSFDGEAVCDLEERHMEEHETCGT